MRTTLTLGAALAVALAVATPVPGAAADGGGGGDVKITDRDYVRYDGGSDRVTARCSTDNRQQLEPAVSVAPHDPRLMTAGAADYCTSPVTGSLWAGFYYSSDRGRTWTNSLLPGYPGDSSERGQESPLAQAGLSAAGDPVQAWDDAGNLYYGGIAYNFSQPASGSIWVARYRWPSGSAAPTYVATSVASAGTPSPLFRGVFEDKVQLEVDRGVSSPYAGRVYVCWARFVSNGTNAVYVASSADQGRTFRVQKVSASVHDSQFCDIAVTRSGQVHVAWRQYEYDAERGQRQQNAVVSVRSTDGGGSFTRPSVATAFLPWDPSDATTDPAAYGRAKHSACHGGDGTLGGCAGAEPRVHAGDCGDGPLACRSGYVFHRASSQVRITADPTAWGDPDQVFVVYEGSVPGSQTSTGTTYGTLGEGVGSQAAVYLLTSRDAGRTWSGPTRVDPQQQGHQYFPDVVAEAGQLHAVWQDSRADGARGPGGRDFRSVPVSNVATAGNPPGSVSSGGGIDTYYARSQDGGASWTRRKVSSRPTMPQFEQFAGRDVPFLGDYNYIAASGPTVVMAWTDQRDTVPGEDPRYPVDGRDGFDVHQCLAARPDGTFGPNTCSDAGGLDSNVYGAVLGG